MTPLSEIRLGGRNLNSQLSILAAGTVYYTIILVLALSHLESKFIMDGFSHVFTIANWGTFAAPMGRHVLVLHQLLPVIASNLGVSIRGIMEAYVVGDVLFHFSIFLCLLFVLKDKWAALFAVSVHVFGMCYNHFMMVGELHPGSMFAIMALSIICHWDYYSKRQKTLIVPAAFFTVSSHPLALVGFLVSAWLWRTATDRNIGLGYLKLMALSLVMLLFKWLLLDAYDQQTVGRTLRTFSEAAVVLLDSSYLLNFTLFFLFTSPVVAAMMLFGVLYLIDRRKYVTVLLFFAFQIGWMILVQQYLDFTYFSLSLIQSMMHDRYLFPMRFVAMSMLFLVVIPLGVRKSAWSNVQQYVFASWALCLPFLFFSAQKADTTIADFRNVIHIAREQGIAKGYYPVEEYCDDAYIHNGSFYATFILSSIDLEQTCQILHASEETMMDLRHVKTDELLLMDGNIISTKMLNEKHFHIQSGTYKKLKYRCGTSF